MDQVPERPAEITARLAAGIADRTGRSLVGVYLHGSAVLGGWVAGRSDVDVLVVAADDADNATAEAMAQVIVEAAARQCAGDRGPAPTLETSIVAAASARDPGPPWPYLRHVVVSPANPARIGSPDAGGGDRDLLMHYAVCRAAGHAAFGPPPREVIGPIPRAGVLAYLADELDWGLANASEAYAVLNACRARFYLTDGTIVSKLAGGQAALSRCIGPADVISRALTQQRGARPDQPSAPAATDFVLATAALLRAGGCAAAVVEPDHDRDADP